MKKIIAIPALSNHNPAWRIDPKWQRYATIDAEAYQLGIASWAAWCKKNKVQLEVFTSIPFAECGLTQGQYDSVMKLPPTITRWLMLRVFNDRYGSCKVAMIDADTLVMQDSPSIIDAVPDKKIGAVLKIQDKDDKISDWMRSGIDLYQKMLFPDVALDTAKYFGAGVVVCTGTQIADDLMSIVLPNADKLLARPNWKGGADQTIINFLAQIKNWPMFDLPYIWSIGKKQKFSTDGNIIHFKGKDKSAMVTTAAKCGIKIP